MAVQKIGWLCLVIAAALWWENGHAQSLERFTFAEPQLGTIVELTIYAQEEIAANEAARTAYARVKELDLIFSDYKPDSEAMRLCDAAGSGTPVKVSDELFQTLRKSLAISERTEGAFDVTVGPLIQLWRRARKTRQLPSEAEVASAKELVGWKLVSLNESDRTVELKRKGMRLDFGGIGKCLIAQDVCRLLRDRGFPKSLVMIAGDIAAGDPPPNTESWKIGIAPLKGGEASPSRRVALKNQAISTAGDAFQYVEIQGKRYSHIVDPKTGMGLTQSCSVTVISQDGAAADGYDTAICVLGPERGLAILEQVTGLEAFIMLSTPEGVKTFESKGFHRLLVDP